MYVTEYEYERDPSLLVTRFYDKINPMHVGFEEYNNRRGYLGAEGNQVLREEAKARKLAAQDRQYST